MYFVVCFHFWLFPTILGKSVQLNTLLLSPQKKNKSDTLTLNICQLQDTYVSVIDNSGKSNFDRWESLKFHPIHHIPTPPQMKHFLEILHLTQHESNFHSYIWMWPYDYVLMEAPKSTLSKHFLMWEPLRPHVSNQQNPGKGASGANTQFTHFVVCPRPPKYCRER